jgi:hypothetical protein
MGGYHRPSPAHLHPPTIRIVVHFIRNSRFFTVPYTSPVEAACLAAGHGTGSRFR